MDEKKGFFELLDSKSALLVGLVGGVLTLGTLGFIVLGVKTLKAGSWSTTPGAGNVVQQPAPGGTQPTPSRVDVGVGHFPPKGDAKAKVTVIEFADYRCPFCERFYTSSAVPIIRDYVSTGKVKFYFRSWAFLGPASTVTSEAAECAQDQGAFWKFHDWLFEHQASESDTAYYSKDNLIKYAANLGLNKTQFASCLNSGKFAAQVQQDLADGQAAGVDGTPTTFVNGTPIVGAVPYAQIKAAIDQALAK